MSERVGPFQLSFRICSNLLIRFLKYSFVCITFVIITVLFKGVSGIWLRGGVFRVWAHARFYQYKVKLEEAQSE